MKKFAIAFSVFALAVAVIAIYVGPSDIDHQYCKKQSRVIPDSEFIQIAKEIRLDEIRSRGGIDNFESILKRANRNPEHAGRDFDDSDPNCCQVYRGHESVRKSCAWDYPVCVRLYFPEREDMPDWYIRAGRSYLFSECGEIKERF